MICNTGDVGNSRTIVREKLWSAEARSALAVQLQREALRSAKGLEREVAFCYNARSRRKRSPFILRFPSSDVAPLYEAAARPSPVLPLRCYSSPRRQSF